jgi:hypothetical protein
VDEPDRNPREHVEDSAPVVVEDAAPAVEDEPPVVARLVVEIRSDGSRTIARGAIEDRNLGQAAAVKIEAKTPAALARALMRALLSVPRLGGDQKRRAALPRLAQRLNPFRRRS